MFHDVDSMPLISQQHTGLASHQLAELSQQLSPLYDTLLDDLQLKKTHAIATMLTRVYLPLAAWISRQSNHEPLIMGINGAQGTGKSSLAYILRHLLESGFNRHTISLSIDDLYLGRNARLKLAKDVHPLLATRGVPGTHDIELGLKLLRQLKSGLDRPFSIPVFDKAGDDQAPPQQWQQVTKPVDIVLFEGWCVGSTPCPDTALAEPVNELEQLHDPDGTWREFVN